MVIKPVKKSKNPPILSHAFIIQNHGDIVSCVAMVIVIGLMFQVTTPLASIFIILQHNIVADVDPDTHSDVPEVVYYSNGVKDFAAIFFYGLIAIVVHAIVQDYVLDRINRKLHLSKSKHSQFNESGQLLLFSLFAAAWGLHIIFRDEMMVGFSSLWTNYPENHARLTFRFKFYFLIQIAYWLHCYPELYFQKVKKEEILERVLYTTLHLGFISAAYALNFTHVGLKLLVLHYLSEAILHASRLCHYAEMSEYAAKGFKVYNILFVVFRLVSLILAILTFHFGLSGSSVPVIDVATGNFNTPLIRLLSVAAVCAGQGWMMWNFLTFHLRKRSEQKAALALASASKKKKNAQKAAKKSKRGSDDEVALLPEVDQNTRRRK